MSKNFNGGYALKLGETEWKLLSGYSPSWEEVEAENFENYDFKNITAYKGIRFSAGFKVSKLSEEDKNALLAALAPRNIYMECPDYKGNVKISSVSAELISANHMGKWYSVSFNAAASELMPLGGGL
jgi:hypothetical protein|nr:MAG TPA: hypothetical protein [Caudoviricetes sp.]